VDTLQAFSFVYFLLFLLILLAFLRGLIQSLYIMKHKKFIVFAWATYYPGGGLNDISASFDTLEEAKSHAFAQHEDFLRIVDRDTWEVVFSND
jgi:hypothetical protein